MVVDSEPVDVVVDFVFGGLSGGILGSFGIVIVEPGPIAGSFGSDELPEGGSAGVVGVTAVPGGGVVAGAVVAGGAT